MATVRREEQLRAIVKWDEELKETQARLGITGQSTVSSVEVIREIRDGYDLRDD